MFPKISRRSRFLKAFLGFTSTTSINSKRGSRCSRCLLGQCHHSSRGDDNYKGKWWLSAGETKDGCTEPSILKKVLSSWMLI
jgi:hypothetical protein